MKAAPEKILLFVILSVVVIAFSAAAAYVFLFSDEGGKTPTTTEGSAETTAAEETEPTAPPPPENSVDFSYPADTSDDDDAAVPDAIISFFSYLDGGDYDRLPPLCAGTMAEALRNELADERAREQKSGIFSVKKARLLSAEKVSSYWRCCVDVEYFDGNEDGDDGDEGKGDTTYFLIDMSYTLYYKNRIFHIYKAYQPDVEAQ